MGEWVRLCGQGEAPGEGEVREMAAGGRAVCVARHEGQLHALDNVCPHRQGPLGEGWLEGGAVLCPWHAWAFDLHTGEASAERSRVDVFALREREDFVEIELP